MSALPQRPALARRPALPRMRLHDFDLIARRTFDVGVALAGLICLAPLFALIASAVSYRAAFFAVAACVLAVGLWQIGVARRGNILPG